MLTVVVSVVMTMVVMMMRAMVMMSAALPQERIAAGGHKNVVPLPGR